MISDALKYVSGRALSDPGKVRQENQDAVLVIEEAGVHLYAVADGMGGVHGGGRASQIAVEAIAEFVRQEVGWDEYSLARAFNVANQRVRDATTAEPALVGMGTTLVCVAFSDSTLYWANVGDSRCYLIRGAATRRLTDDHTVIADLIRAGSLKAEQGEKGPLSHLLTRCLGSSEDFEVDSWTAIKQLRSGDRLLLCSDGLYNHVNDEEIASIVSRFGAESPHQLVAKANEAGGTDNITVLLVEIAEGYPAGESAANSSFVATKLRPLSASRPARESETHVGLTHEQPQPEMKAPSLVTLGPIQGALILFLTFLLGLLIGSSASRMPNPGSQQIIAETQGPDDEGRASFRRVPDPSLSEQFNRRNP